MTALYRRIWTGVLACMLLLLSLHAKAAQSASTCIMEDKLPLALSRAQQHERELHKFDSVEIVPGSFERTQIVDDVFEYAANLSLHEAVFLLHGATVDFRTSFLPSLLSSHVPRKQSFAVFLAQRNIDVWGLDMRSTLLPADTTDFAFMQDWNYATDIHDIAVSLALARRLRNITGSGFQKMHLIGWSNGGTLTYAYANHETRFPRGHRHVKGLVPVDTVFKFSPDDESLRQDACTRATVLKSFALDVGIFPTDERTTRQVGFLAETAPDDLSPIVPGLTNRTVVLAGAAVTWQALFPPGFPPFVPFYHTLAGQFDPVSELPTDWTYARTPYVFDLLQEFPSWWVVREFFEFNALPTVDARDGRGVLSLQSADRQRLVALPSGRCMRNRRGRCYQVW